MEKERAQFLGQRLTWPGKDLNQQDPEHEHYFYL